MRRTLFIVSNSLLFPLLGTAQSQTSPKGHLAVEANSQISVVGADGYSAGMVTYWRQVDGTLATIGATTIANLKLRRDGTTPTNTTSIGRTVTFSLRLAHGDYAKVLNHTDQLDTSWLSGSWSTVTAPRSLVLPDLRNQPATTPAPWSITLPFDAPYSFSGTKALAIDLRVSQSNLSGNLPYVLDMYAEPSSSSIGSTPLGTGCTTNGAANPVYLSATTFHYGDGALPGSMNFLVSNAPKNAAAWWLVGASDPALELGLCTKLRSSSEVVVPLPATSATGIVSHSLAFAVQPSMVGAKVYMQTVVADAGQPGLPFALSNGAIATMPAAPVFTTQCARSLLWSPSTTWFTGSSWTKNSGLVFAF